MAIRFILNQDVLEFSKNMSLPVIKQTENIQVVDRTASGSLMVENLGVAINRRRLVFKSMPEADYDKLVNWFNNVAVGAYNSFSYEDERQYLHTIRIISNTLSFQEFEDGWFSGELLVEIE